MEPFREVVASRLRFSYWQTKPPVLLLSEKAPDHSVFSRFRGERVEHGIHERLFNELNRQLEERGLIVKKGTLVDATIIEAAPKKPRKNEDGTAGKSEQDPEADWTKKGGR